MEVNNQTISDSTFENKSNDGSNLKGISYLYVTVYLSINFFSADLIFQGISGIGCFANLLLVTYVIKCHRYRSPIFVLIMNLGMADASNCISAISWIIFRSKFAVGPDFMCNVTTFLAFLANNGSNYTIAVISAIRFYQLVFPLSAHAKLTSKLVMKICFFVWINAFTVGITFALFNGIIFLRDSRGDFKICTYIGDYREFYNAVGAIWVHLLPLVITVLVHFAKHVILRKAGDSAQVTGMGEIHGRARETTDIRAVLIVVIVYIMTTMPLVGLFITFCVTGISRAVIPITTNIINKIYWINSAVNPFIYAFAAETVRKDIRTMFRCKPPGNEGSK